MIQVYRSVAFAVEADLSLEASYAGVIYQVSIKDGSRYSSAEQSSICSLISALARFSRGGGGGQKWVQRI